MKTNLSRSHSYVEVNFEQSVQSIEVSQFGENWKSHANKTAVTSTKIYMKTSELFCLYVSPKIKLFWLRWLFYETEVNMHNHDVRDLP